MPLCLFVLDLIFQINSRANQPAGTQGATTSSTGTQDADSNSDCDEQVIIVPSYPSHSIQGTQPIDTPGDKVDDSPFPSADEIFQKELARLKGEEQRDTSYDDSPALGTANNVVDLQTPPSAQPVPPGCIPVPTSNVLVPTGSISIPAAAIMVPTDDVPIHTSSSTGSMFDGVLITRFICPSDHGNHNPSLGTMMTCSSQSEFESASCVPVELVVAPCVPADKGLKYGLAAGLNQPAETGVGLLDQPAGLG
nr:hypothetical protein [Tanacetum cinerariifolium]